MGKMVNGDDGLPVEEVGEWAKKKHEILCRYIDISRGARRQYLGAEKAGATYIDLFCGPGRCLIKDTTEYVDGGAVAAWKESCSRGSPFSKVIVADLDEKRRAVCAQRLKKLGAPVMEVSGSALDAAHEVVGAINKYGLNFAFLDPFGLRPLDFEIIRLLSSFKRMDMMIHLSTMDLQRNLDLNTGSEDSDFDVFAPGWREHVNMACSQVELRAGVINYWRGLVGSLGVWPSTRMKLITGSKNQRLYWLLLAAKHDLPLQFWEVAANLDKQGSFVF